MPVFTWTFVQVGPSPVTVGGVVDIPPINIPTNQVGASLPIEQDIVKGSRSWVLVNKDGGMEMVQGEMDILLEYGHVRELTEPSLILDQRLRKCVLELRRSNRFAQDWGTRFRELLGSKNFSETTLKEIGKFLRQMVAALIDLQNETLQRIRLADAEQIDSVNKINIISEGSEITVYMNVITKAQESVDMAAAL